MPQPRVPTLGTGQEMLLACFVLFGNLFGSARRGSNPCTLEVQGTPQSTVFLTLHFLEELLALQ